MTGSDAHQFYVISVSDKDKYRRLDECIKNRRPFGLLISKSNPHLELYKRAVDRVLRTGYPGSRLREFMTYMRTRDVYVFWSIAVNSNDFSGNAKETADGLLVTFDPNV